MEVPDLVKQALGDEDVQAGVSLGDEDAVCLTPTRTLVYRGEGLLSDEQIEEFSHDVERIAVSEGRRKSKFELTYVGGVETFSVPSDRTDTVLELFMEGVLRRDGVIDGTESLVGVYRFSELTLIIAEHRALKHVGEAVWDEDFESYPFSAVTELAFEEASVATSIALTVDGRPQRVKVPNARAPVVRQDLENALFDYYEVGSLEQLDRALADSTAEADESAAEQSDDGDDLEFGSGIDPLVTDSPDDTEIGTEFDDRATVEGDGSQAASSGGTDGDDRSGRRSGDASGSDRSRNDVPADGGETTRSGEEAARSPDEEAARSPDENASSRSASSADQREESATQNSRATAERGDRSQNRNGGRSPSAESAGEPRDGGSQAPARSGDAKEGAASATVEFATREDLSVVSAEVEDLAETVERQNELLKRQHQALKRLVSELRE